MAGQWSASPRKLTLTGSSSTGSGTRQCPYCLVPLVKIQSKQLATKGQWFLKCPYNIKDDDTTCGFIRNEQEYEALEVAERHLQAGKSASSDCYADLKEELDEVKQTLASVVADLWKMKVLLPAAPRPEPKVESKQIEPKAESKQIVLDFLVFVGFVGVIIGVVVACMWK